MSVSRPVTVDGHENCEVVGLIEIAERLGINHHTLLQAKKTGRFTLEPIGVVSGSSAYCLEEVRAWFDTHGWPQERATFDREQGITARVRGILDAEPHRVFTAQDVYDKLTEQGWQHVAKEPIDNVHQILLHCYRDGTARRVERGRYQSPNGKENP